MLLVQLAFHQRECQVLHDSCFNPPDLTGYMDVVARKSDNYTPFIELHILTGRLVAARQRPFGWQDMTGAYLKVLHPSSFFIMQPPEHLHLNFLHAKLHVLSEDNKEDVDLHLQFSQMTG